MTTPELAKKWMTNVRDEFLQILHDLWSALRDPGAHWLM